MENSNVTLQLSTAISDLKYDNLMSVQKEDLKYKILDWLGCSIGAISKTSGMNIVKLFEDMEGKGQSTIISGNKKVSFSNAAYANGMLGHVLELDDVHKSSISHPGAVAIPTALAVAEAYNTDIKDFLMGIVAGYEVMIRLGNVLNPSHYEYWHTTGTCGAFASAAAASRVRKYSPSETNLALNMVSTTASGLVSVFGTDAKLVTVGHACYTGTMATLFADYGFTATNNILGTKNGYAEATSVDKKIDKIIDSKDIGLMIDTACYKIHASCGHTHSALDGILSVLNDEKINSSDIEKVEIGTYKKAVELTGKFSNENEQKAKFSLPYCVACALAFGKISLSEFNDEILHSQQIEMFKNKIDVNEDEECTRLYPEKRMAKIKIFANNKIYEKTVPLPFGKPPKKYIQEKFLSLATMTVSQKNAEIIMNHILNIDQMKDMKEFVNVFKYIKKNKE